MIPNQEKRLSNPTKLLLFWFLINSIFDVEFPVFSWFELVFNFQAVSSHIYVGFSQGYPLCGTCTLLQLLVKEANGVYFMK